MSLVVWLPLTKDLRQQGLSNVTITNNGATFDSAGKLGGCYSFNGSSKYISITNPLKSASEVSCAVWVKPSTNTSTNEQIINIGTSAGWNNIRFGILQRSINQFIFHVSDGTNNITYSCISGTIVVDQWIHISCIYKNRELKMYLNGELVKTYSISFDPSFTGITNIGIGAAPDGYEKFTGYISDVRIYDHALSQMEIKELVKGLVLHYPLSDKFIEGTTNLVTGITSGGQTTWENNILTTSGTNADTYFTINLSESIVNGTQYTISCDAKDIPQGTCWTFPLGQQSNTTLSFQIYNGHNEYTFTANDISWGANRCFMDDGGSPNSARATGARCKIYNIQIEKKNHATGFAGYGGTRNSNTVYDCSGFCNNSILNTSTTISTDTAKYTHSTYFGGYDTPKTELIDTSFLSSLTNCSIAWWAKTDVAKTLFFTGQDGSHYVMASDNNNFYHQNAGSPIIYRDGVAGTYKNEAGVWHHYVMTGVNLSSWTQFKINSYGSGWPLKGLINDVRIYATILPANDIKSLYQNSAYIDSSGNVYGAVHEEV